MEGKGVEGLFWIERWTEGLIEGDVRWVKKGAMYCSGAAREEKRRRIVNGMAMGSGSIDEVEDIKESEVVE